MTNDSSQNVLLGVALILATAFMISAQDVVFKLFSSAATLWQIFALRGLMALPLLVLIARGRGLSLRDLQSGFTLWPLLRGLCLTVTFLAFYAALPFLSLATVGAANYIAPVFVALLSAFVIGERVSWMVWLGACLGFAGVIVLLQPGSDAFSPFALLPIAGAGFYAIGHIITRTRCQSVPLEALSLSVNAGMCLAGCVISVALLLWVPEGAAVTAFPYILGPWSLLDTRDWLVLLVLTGFAVINGMMLAGAYKAGPPAVIATFEYSYLVFAATWDILLFGTPLTGASGAGIVMIVAAGLLVMRGRNQEGT